jgi:thymidylate kinase
MRVIVLEGINAAGKTSVGKAIGTAIHGLGLQCKVVDPAAFGPIGKLLRERIVDPSFRDNADLDAVLFAALRAEGAQHIVQELGPMPGLTLVLERWSLALAAYGSADGSRPQLVSELRSVLDSLLKIDFTLLLDISGAEALRRFSNTGRKNRFELRGREYLDRVAQAYREAAGKDIGETELINACADPYDVCTQLKAALGRRFPELSDADFVIGNGGTEQLNLLPEI